MEVQFTFFGPILVAGKARKPILSRYFLPISLTNRFLGGHFKGGLGEARSARLFLRNRSRKGIVAKLNQLVPIAEVHHVKQKGVRTIQLNGIVAHIPSLRRD